MSPQVRGLGLLLTLLFLPGCTAGGSVNRWRLQTVQTNSTSLDRGGLKSINGGKGFRSVESLLKVQNGDVYVGTYFGLHWTNGDKWFEVIDLRNMEITSLLQVKNGDIYAGTPHGLYYSIDHDNHSSYYYYTDIHCAVKSMLQTQEGDIYVGTTEGLFCSQDNGYSWDPYFAGFAVTALLQVDDGTIYMTGNWFARLGMANSGYNLYYGHGSPAKWAGTDAVALNKRPTSLGQVRWLTASGVRQDVILVGFEDGLYGVIEGEEPQLSSWKRILDSNHVNFIHTLYASQKWRSSIIIGDEDGVAYSVFTKLGRLPRKIFPSLRGCSVSSLLVKRKEKVLFFGVARGGDRKLAGVYRGQMQHLYPFEIENFDYLDLWLYPVYRAFLQGSDGTLYVGGEHGLYSFTINNRGYRVQLHLIHQCYVTCLAEDDDDQKSIYVGTDKGLYRWIKSSNLWRRIEYVGDAVTVLAKVRGEENGKGDFFLAGTRSKGFYQRNWQTKSWQSPLWYCPDPFNINLLADYHVSILSLVKYKNQYVVGTDHGVYWLDKVEYGHWQLVGQSHSAIVHTLFKSAETLYAGTDVGLWSTKSGDLTSHWTREVLPGNPASVFTMLECTKRDQRYGFVLTGTGRGLFYRDPEDKTNKWQTASIFQRSTIYALFQSQNGDVCISVFNSRIWVSPVELPNKK